MPAFNQFQGVIYWGVREAKGRYDHNDPFLRDPVKAAHASLASDLLEGNIVRADATGKPFFETADLATALEIAHYGYSHVALHVTRNLFSWIMNTGFHTLLLDDVVNLKLPWRIFEVCFEHGCHVPTTQFQMPAFLASFDQDSGSHDVMTDIFNHTATLIHDRHPQISTASLQSSFRAMPSAFKTCILALLPDHSNNSRTIHPFYCPNKCYSHPLDQLAFDTTETIKFSWSNHDIGRTLMQALAGIACYLNTKECDIQTLKSRNRSRIGQDPESLIIGQTTEIMPPAAHLRKAHFRLYGDSRYKRNDDGTPRIGWVRPALIAKGQDPANPQRKEINFAEPHSVAADGRASQ